MSSLYKQRDTWYLNLSIYKKRMRISLRTANLSTAKKLAKEIKPNLIKNLLTHGKPVWAPDMSDKNILLMFLDASHGWKDSTRDIYRQKLSAYFKHGFPSNKSSRAMTIRCLNKMYRWAYDKQLISTPKKIEGGSKWETRMRTFSDDELELLLNKVTPHKFQLFVRFAYYTGARRGEIACLRQENITQQFVSGKSGKRQIKLNLQARETLEEVGQLWDYKGPYISQTFKKNLRRLGIKDGRFHDLRRTFGLNLIKQGMGIYEVSKLLGHRSVRTTEKHYAPLLVTQIRDFKL